LSFAFHSCAWRTLLDARVYPALGADICDEFVVTAGVIVSLYKLPRSQFVVGFSPTPLEPWKLLMPLKMPQKPDK